MYLKLQKVLILSVLAMGTRYVSAQRAYHTTSVLASGNWYKISVGEEGVYKIDLAFLNNLGISGPLPSSQIRLYGNGGVMLPESNAEKPIDDLEENDILVVDGGDGLLNGSDYILFFAPGPDTWLPDPVNKRFGHRKNRYSDKAYYYLTIGGSGKRIPIRQNPGGAATIVTSFSERYFHEVDAVNFLSSGKEWFGEEFSGSPGRALSQSFPLPFNDLMPGEAALSTSVAARSVNTPGRFEVQLNNQVVQQLEVSPISTGLYDLFARQSEKTDPVFLNQDRAVLSLTYVPGSFNSQGWLNWFAFFCRRKLALTGSQLLFRDWYSVGAGRAEFEVAGAGESAQAWDVTDPLHPVKMDTRWGGGALRFTNEAQSLHEYVCFSGYLTPKPEGMVPNQDLHRTVEKDLFVIAYPPFMAEAQRLALFHEQRHHLRTIVVSTDQVFNEFSGGIPDPTAIRDFIKMYHDRYAASWDGTGKYLLLFGKGSFDYKGRITGNTNLVPAYESASSLDPLSTYTSDDFFGFLDDAEDINSALVVNQLDLGIGRIPAKSGEEARNFVNKLIEYHAPASLGPWRNNIDFIADDEDMNLHLQDAETLAGTVLSTAPVFNEQKVYLDAYRQESGSSGGRYPQANAVINSHINNGLLIWNYSGHGGPRQLAEEVVLDHQVVSEWTNRNRLPLFITATCDFAPFDQPLVNSLGEDLLLRQGTGAIGLMTTTRLVFAYSNRQLNNNYLRFAFEKKTNGSYRSLGEAMMAAKNYTYQTSGDLVNNRKFTFLGDPAMILGFPTLDARLIKVNDRDVSVQADTLRAAEAVVIEGAVYDRSGQVQEGFHGTAYLTLFDKAQNITTLANDAGSQPASFASQENSLFRGKASIQNGTFSFRFRMPRDINYQFGQGKVSLYVQNGAEDGHGHSDKVVIGGISAQTVNDQEGPVIRAYLNDEQFVNGSITNASPLLIVKLDDSSGINTGGAGIGHDIVATIDNDSHQYYVLNNFFESELDDPGKGSLRFQLPALPAGPHSLKIKAWDVMNNSGEYQLDFTVVNQDELRIDHVLNYPNPFTTRTAFWFEHNYPATDLLVRVEIYTVSGRLIKSISRTINTPGNRSREIEWDGKDEFGMRVGKGVYIYRLSVKANGKTAGKWERLVLLR